MGSRVDASVRVKERACMLRRIGRLRHIDLQGSLFYAACVLAALGTVGRLPHSAQGRWKQEGTSGQAVALSSVV